MAIDVAIDVTDATFEAEVLQRSMTTPVVVDLWAPWCGPCKTLTPILEKVIGETGGQVVLAKINVDENPQASQAFQVQSIPAVFALDQGQVVDNFMGAQPEAQVREFVAKLAGPGGAAAGGAGDEIAQLLMQGDEESLRKVLELDEGNKQAAAMLTQLLLQDDRAAEAVTMLSAIPEGDEDIAQMLTIARSAALPPEAQNEIDAKLTELLGKVKEDEEAKAEFLELLDELAKGDPGAASGWRRKLATQLF